MLTFESTKAFRKDVQKLAARGYDILKLLYPLTLLLSGQPLPPRYQDHPLKGEWDGHRDFHVEPNWVVIYQLTDNCLYLSRTGTHADVLGE
jgi:mRNA interferase YafQ